MLYLPVQLLAFIYIYLFILYICFLVLIFIFNQFENLIVYSDFLFRFVTFFRPLFVCYIYFCSFIGASFVSIFACYCLWYVENSSYI